MVWLSATRAGFAEEAIAPSFLEAAVDEQGQHCELHGQFRDEQRLLLACGAAGVWEVATDTNGLRFVRSYGFAGEVVGLFAEPDGQLWVKLKVLEARPFSRTATQRAARFPDATATVDSASASSAPPGRELPAAPPVPTATPTPAGQAPLGRVVSSEPGFVVISIGAADGLSRSDRIELSLQTDARATDADAALDRETIAIGVVTNVNEHSAKVRLGLNESAPIGALAMPSHGPLSASLSAPPRAAGLWSVELAARPFVALSELGGGALLSGSVGRRFVGPLHLRAVLDPLAFAAVKSSQRVKAISGAILASYDSHYLEMGLGFGAETVNETDFLIAAGSGLSVAQLIRLGAQDGLNLSLRSSVVLFHSQFQFGGLFVGLHIPVSRGYWLLLDGGGGNVGYGYGELGLRTLLVGNGGAGSTFLTVTAGGAALFRSEFCGSPFAGCTGAVSYGGPMAGIGGEWRF